MKDIAQKLWTEIAKAPSGAKIAAVLSIVALCAVAWIGSAWANRPSFVLFGSDLDAPQAAAVQSALASANVRYQVSQPPGPFVIHVEEQQLYAAQNAVALAGALSRAPEGIATSTSGAAQVFQSASERAQSALKREWQELENQLEELDFVRRAHVSTSVPDPSPLKRSQPMTVAVTLTLRGGQQLTRTQSQAVAKLARFRFNVPAENVVVTDQSGLTLFDGGNEEGTPAEDLFERKTRYDAELARRTNDALDRVLGEGVGYVIVDSQWRYEEVESVKEVYDPKNKVVVSETSSRSTTPQGNNGLGTSASAAPGGTDPSAAAPVASAPEALAETNDSTKETIVGKETSLRRTSAPALQRLSVSLFVDQSKASELAALEKSVQAAVGFDPQRGDTMSSMTSAFAALATKEDEGAGTVEDDGEMSPLATTLIERGVEILAAAAFLFVLLRSLKGLKKSATATQPRAQLRPDGMSEERFLEMLAKKDVEELLAKDPERVATILARWTAEEQPVGAGR